MRRIPWAVAGAVALVAGLAAAPPGGAVGAPASDVDDRPRIYTVGNQFVPGEVILPVVSDVRETTVPLVIEEGEEVVYEYVAGVPPHDVSHDGCRVPNDADPCLFQSAVIGSSGQTSVVEGVAALAPGSYDFYCSIHPNTMFGRIVVEEAS